MSTKQVIEDIRYERVLQNEKWEQQDHSPLYWLAILMEEVGEVAETVVNGYHFQKRYRAELVQVAAVAVAAIESWDREHA